MLEKSVERKCVDYATSIGIEQIKLFVPSHAGYPDRLFFPAGGIPFFVEFKKRDGHLRRKQKKVIQMLTELKYIVFVCYTLEDFKQALVEYVQIKNAVVSVLVSKTSCAGLTEQPE